MTDETITEINHEKEQRNERGKIVLVCLFVIVILGIVCFCYSLSTVPQIFQQRLSVSSPESEMGYALLEEAQDWELVLFDDFAEDKDLWWVGKDSSEYAVYERMIEDGVYRIDATAKKGFISRLTPDIDTVADFYISVDADQVSGLTSGYYGVFFRKLQSNYFVFSINDSGKYSIEIYYSGKWEQLEYGSYFPLAGEDKPRTMAVIGNRSDFYFFINDEFVTYIEDDRLRVGEVGVTYNLCEAGDQGVFEFDNFELRILE